MRGPFIFSLGLMLLALGLAGGREAFSEEESEALRPEAIRIGRIDARNAPFEDLATQLEQACGMEIELDAALAGRSVYLRLNGVSLQSILEVALPSQGATWELRPSSGLRLFALPRPWVGPAEGPRSATPPGTSRALNFRAGDVRVQDLVDRLGLTYRSNLVCDHRIDRRPVRLELMQATLEEGLAKLCAMGGWSWSGNEEIAVILPSGEDQLLRLPSLRWRNWVFEGLTGAEVADELARDFSVPIHLSAKAARVPFTGQIRGKTVGEVVDDYCQQAYCAYAVFDRTLFIAQSSESFRFRGDAVPPQLDIQVELVKIPGDNWMRQRIERIVMSAFPLPPKKMEEQVAQLRQISGAVPLVQHTLTLESGSPGEVRLEPATPEGKDFIILSGRFHYLNRDYARVELSAGSERTEEGWQGLNASMDVEALSLERPYLRCSELQFPDTDRSSVVVFYLKFRVHLPPGEVAAVYRPTVWYIPRGTDRRRDLSNEHYYSHFPGQWSGEFLSHPFFSPSEVPTNRQNEDD